MKILILDNYDSFTYNLLHLVEKITGEKSDVFFNDAISLEAVNDYDRIILSPGPGIPEEAGLLIPLIKEYAASKPILGVCLGHQAIACAFGGSLINLENVYHGLAAQIKKTGVYSPLFKGLPDTFAAGRYHSWIVDAENLPADFEITAVDAKKYIMAMQHTKFNLQSVQFHPESILTTDGEIIMKNWLEH